VRIFNCSLGGGGGVDWGGGKGVRGVVWVYVGVG